MALTNLTKVQTVGIGSNIEVVGVVTTGQFKSGTSNLHSTGIELTNLNVSGIATIGGNLSIGGTLTYQDVTNIDSVGLITARSGINVSGGQLDVGSNIKLGNAGVITATSFVGSGANLTGLNSDLVSDTSPQLGGNLDVKTINIVFGDSSGATDDRLTFGDGTDLSIYHDGFNSRIADGGTGYLINTSNGDGILFQHSSGQNLAKFLTGGAAELYHNYGKKLETRADGVSIFDELSVGTADLQQASVASFVGGAYNQVNIADGSNSGWGLLLAQQQGTNNSSLYTYSTNSSTNKPCSVVNVNNDCIHFATNNTPRFRIEHDGHVIPSYNAGYDLGSSTYRWRNIYINDLNLSNEGSTNIVDNTWGDWTLQEGENDVFMINNRSGKKFKIKMEEVE